MIVNQRRGDDTENGALKEDAKEQKEEAKGIERVVTEVRLSKMKQKKNKVTAFYHYVR